MTRSAIFDVRVVGMAIVLAAFFSCSSKVIHLGDGKGQGGSVANDATIDVRTGASGTGGADGLGDAEGQGGSGALDAATDGQTGLAEAGADAGCPHGQVKASEVLWIGDAWVGTPGNQITRVEELARLAGAIGPNDVYINAAATAATPMRQQSMADVVDQYSRSIQNAGATEFKVLIMDGGTLDPWLFDNTDATINNVVSTFEKLLATVASGGTVEHVIYFHCPENSTFPGTAGIVTLRPLMQQACNQSPVDCHFLDLQDSFAGHPEYLNDLGSWVPSQGGGRVIAEQIWGVMQDNCIAQ